MAIITADHGNADEMYELSKKTGEPVASENGFKAKTSHTLNPVPCIFYDPGRPGAIRIDAEAAKGAGLANLAATTANLLGYQAPEGWRPSLLKFD
jgi:2,3-bisphosphoglycerate-independent phosphoglycerate mutase